VASSETTKYVAPPAPPRGERAEPRPQRRGSGEQRGQARAERGAPGAPGAMPRPVIPKGVNSESLRAQLAEIAQGITPGELESLNLAGQLPVIPPAKDAGWSGVPSTRPAQKAMDDDQDSLEDSEQSLETADDETADLRRNARGGARGDGAPARGRHNENNGRFDDSTVVRGPPAPPKRRPPPSSADRGERPDRPDRGEEPPSQRNRPAPPRRDIIAPPPQPRRKKDDDSALSMFKLGAGVFAILAALGLLLMLAMRVLGH